MPFLSQRIGLTGKLDIISEDMHQTLKITDTIYTLDPQSRVSMMKKFANIHGRQRRNRLVHAKVLSRYLLSKVTNHRPTT